MRWQSRFDHVAIENDRHGQIFIALILEFQYSPSACIGKRNLVLIVAIC